MVEIVDYGTSYTNFKENGELKIVRLLVHGYWNFHPKTISYCIHKNLK